VNNIDSIVVDELSCRSRTSTNVGMDYIINKDFTKGRQSFYRYEMFRPEATWGEKDIEFMEEKCPECPPKDGSIDKRSKCVLPSPAVTKGLARNVFTVL